MRRILASRGRRNRVLWESTTCITTVKYGNWRLSRRADGGPRGAATRRLASLECAPHPATLRRVRKFVRWPIVFVELERDHFRSVVPGDGLQAHRGAIGPPGDGLEKCVQIRSGHSVDFHDPTTRIQSVTRRRRPIRKVTDIHTHGGNSPLHTHGAMRRLQSRAGPLHQAIDVRSGKLRGGDVERLLALAA